MSNVFGGDEVNALVLDIGSSSVKAGYSGDDGPKGIFPSHVGVTQATSEANGMEVDGQQASASKRKLHIGQMGVNYCRENMEVISPFSATDDGFSDWEAVEGLCDFALRDRLRVDPKDFAVLLAEPNSMPRQSRERLVELMFDKLRVPAVFLAKNAVLSSFATARQTALVVDAGYRATTVAVVHDGFLITKAVSKSPFGGQALSTIMQKALEAKGTIFKPRYTFKRKEVAPGEFKVEDIPTPNTHPSFHAYQVQALVNDVREALCKVPDAMFDEVASSNVPTTTYELPDGTEIIVGSDRFKVPEVMFQPRLLSTFTLVSPESFTARQDGTVAQPLPEMVLECINRCDVDVRKDLYQGVVLTGGLSLMGGLRDRLEKELAEQGPQAAKFKVTMPANPTERRFSVWIGGSILASLGSFQQMWVSRKEFDEYGASIIHKKAP